MADEPLPGERLTDAELWRGVEATVRNVLLPALADDWARAAAVQLVGVARYAQRRPADPTAARVAELRVALAALAANSLVAPHLPIGTDDTAEPADDPAAVLGAVGAILAAAVGDDSSAGDEVRRVLRPIVVRHLDEELDVTGPLVSAFRGKLDD